MFQNGTGTLVAHNYVHDVGHHAFRQDGNNHIIEFNVVERVILRSWDAGAYHTGRDLTWRGNVIRYNLNINDDEAAKAAYPCVVGETSCVKAAWYFDDHMSGVEIYGNVIVGWVLFRTASLSLTLCKIDLAFMCSRGWQAK